MLFDKEKENDKHTRALVFAFLEVDPQATLLQTS
jgi:hypothetical protein